MGNSFSQNSFSCSTLRKSRSLRDYTRSTSLITSCISTHPNRRHHSLARAPTDAEIIDVYGSSIVIEKKDLFKQLEYIYSCARKEKGLFGMMTESLQNKHIFAHDEPEKTHELDQTPEDYYMDYQSIYLRTPDGEFLHAYWIYQMENVESKITVLYLHGAGGNISHRLEVLRLFYDNLHCNILIIDYRGFGKSSGIPSELGLYIDAQTAYDYLIYKQNILPDNIIVLGTSLGASVAIQLVSDPLNRVKLAIFENAFISIPEIAKYFLTYAKSVLGVTKSIGFLYLFDSLSKVRRIECSCMYLTGLLDPIIPPWMSTTLYNQTCSAQKCQLFEYPFGKHNDLSVMENYFENIQKFIEELSSNKSEVD